MYETERYQSLNNVLPKRVGIRLWNEIGVYLVNTLRVIVLSE